MLIKDYPIKFNRGLITLIDGKLFFNQECQYKNLTIINYKYLIKFCLEFKFILFSISKYIISKKRCVINL